MRKGQSDLPESRKDFIPQGIYKLTYHGQHRTGVRVSCREMFCLSLPYVKYVRCTGQNNEVYLSQRQ